MVLDAKKPDCCIRTTKAQTSLRICSLISPFDICSLEIMKDIFYVVSAAEQIGLSVT